MAVNVPVQAIRDAQAADGELWPVLLAIAGPESTWNPAAIGDQGCSLGYLQFNTCGGLGQGHYADELLDGKANMRLGAQTLRAALASGKNLYDALQPWSTRDAALALLAQMQAAGVEGAGSIPTIPGTTGSSIGSPALAWIGLAVVALLVIGG